MEQPPPVTGSVQQSDESLSRKKKDPNASTGKNIVVLKSTDVTTENDAVFMPNTIEMARLKKAEKGQFKTNVQISSKMSQDVVRELLIKTFPCLEHKRFYCASAADNRTRLEFHGEPRIWDGHLIKQKIKGNSVLYIFTDEESFGIQHRENVETSGSDYEELQLSDIPSDSGIEASDCQQVWDGSVLDTLLSGLTVPDIMPNDPCSDVLENERKQDLSLDDNSAPEFQMQDSALEDGMADDIIDMQVELFGGVLDISPSSCSLEGGIPFYIILKQELPDEVKKGEAQFQGVASVTVSKLNPFTFCGIVPSSQVPGVVDVSVITDAGQLGIGLFEYIDVFKQLVENRMLQARYLAMLSVECAKGNLTSGSDIQGFLNQLNVHDHASSQDKSTTRLNQADGSDDESSDYFADAETSSSSSSLDNDNKCTEIPENQDVSTCADTGNLDLCNEIDEPKIQDHGQSDLYVSSSCEVNTAANNEMPSKLSNPSCDSPEEYRNPDSCCDSSGASFPRMGLSPSHKMSEPDIHNYELPYSIGMKWKDLARVLGYLETAIDTTESEKCYCAKECCIKLLVEWINREGNDATAARLADALRSAGLKNLADILIHPNNPSQVSRLGNRTESELEEQLSSARQKCQQKEEEILKLNNIIDELKEELSAAKLGCHDFMQKEEDFPSDTEQADREHRIDGQLKRINEHLSMYVTSPLQVPVVKQDQLRMAVKLDLLIRLSENLQGLYNEIQGMISEAAKCSEDLRRGYYDLTYHGLRAEHYDLVHRVVDLESELEEMSEEEKREYERLQSFQKDRQRQVEGLDKVWRRLFSPVGRLPKSTVSDPTSNKSRGSKKFMRHTDPSDRPRKFKLREETDSGTGVPSTSTEGKPDESRVNLVREVKSAVGSVFQTISRKRGGGEKQSSSVPYALMRVA